MIDARQCTALAMLMLCTACATPERIVLLPDAGAKPTSIEVRGKSGNAVLSVPYAEAVVTARDTVVGKTDAESVAKRYVDVIAATPGGETQVGINALSQFWSALISSFSDTCFEIEHLVANERPGRATSIAMRWRVQAVHTGAGRYGVPSGRPVEVMGISHADVEQGRILREWVLMDDVAIWMQVLSPRA